MTDFAGIIRVLAQAEVDFIVVGGIAAAAHGAAATYDVDVVYARSPDNIARLAEALATLKPYLRGRRRDCRSAGTPKPSPTA